MKHPQEHPPGLLKAFLSASTSAVLQFTRRRNKEEPVKYVVLHQCVVAQNMFQSIAEILGGRAGSPEIGFGLCRTLLEITCSTIYLAEHPSELDDFYDFGELKRLRMEKTLGADLTMDDAQRLGELDKRFRKKGGGRISTWHCQRTEDLIVHAGFGRGFVALHNEASSVLHGDALGTVVYAIDEAGDLFKAGAILRRWPAAIRCSTQIHEHLLVHIDRCFGLGVDQLSAVSNLASRLRRALPSPFLD